MKKLIVIPTYNEKKNISIILKKILKLYKSSFDILIIDDNSPDGTHKEVLKFIKKHKFIKLIVRKMKLGIGSAHKCGIKYAFKRKYEILITMDSDGTHDPKYIKNLMTQIKKYDLISTNRFKNHKSLNDWPVSRKLLTSVRHLIIKLFLGISIDASGAYRCYNLKNIKYNHMLAAKDNGYSFFWESIFILVKKKYSIYEIPIDLPYRSIGSSKMKLKDIIYAIIYLMKISFTNSKF